MRIAIKALTRLGTPSILLYARYQFGLRSGWYRLRSGPALLRQVARPMLSHPEVRLKTNLFPLPSPQALSEVLGEAGCRALLDEADQIVQGRVSLFGSESFPTSGRGLVPTSGRGLVPLQLTPDPPLSHWTVHARRLDTVKDIKFTWEPARFGWAIVLARAYRLSADERYPAAFWEYTRRFMEGNPPYNGPNWVSAQEVALRLISLVFSFQVFAASLRSTPEGLSWLTEVIAQHAARLPLTLAYARAQNNNHLLSEAAGLLTASLVLPSHTASQNWFRLGWRWFAAACQSQFDQDGAYIQHSASYHRLALHLALWVDSLLRHASSTLAPHLLQALSGATRWLLDLHDPLTGSLPNLGPNDGALLLPLSTNPIGDYRPVLQAASRAFLGALPFPSGPWDEALLWLDLPSSSLAPTPSPSDHDVGLAPAFGLGRALDHPSSGRSVSSPLSSRTPNILRSSDGLSWAYLRLAHFTSRPGHADQLHFDLWWRGLNLAQDAGTFLYNGSPPWDNALVSAEHHNTLTVDGLDQMLRLSRFLYLDWAQAHLLSFNDCSLTAEHDGYRRLGLIHRRTVSVSPGAWRVEDSLLPQPAYRPSTHTACLHWLLPDWEYSVIPSPLPGTHVSHFSLQLTSPHGQLQVMLSGGISSLQITRAGQLVYGVGPARPTWGWVSPTYGLKLPALSVRLSQTAVPPLSFTTLFTLPG